MLRSTLTHSTRRATAAVVASSSSSSQQVARLALVFPAAAAARIGSSVQQPQRRAYHEKVMDHYNKPRNVRTSPFFFLQRSLSTVLGEKRREEREGVVRSEERGRNGGFPGVP